MKKTTLEMKSNILTFEKSPSTDLQSISNYVNDLIDLYFLTSEEARNQALMIIRSKNKKFKRVC